MKATFVVLIALVGSSIGANIPLSSGRIVGGEVAAKGAAPHQASLRYNGGHFCAASIIHKRWVLTASHCVYAENRAPVKETSLGSRPFGYRRQSRPPGICPAARLACPPLSSHVNHSMDHTNDIAVLKLSADILFTPLIQPIALDREGTADGSKVNLTGWGSLSYPGGQSPVDLQIIQLLTISVAECTARMSDINTVVDSEVCTLTKKGEGACHGDSGGALTRGNITVGIVSWGQPCANGYPDVFTRVSSFIAWIDEQMFPDRAGPTKFQ